MRYLLTLREMDFKCKIKNTLPVFGYTVSENQYHAPRLTVFCLAHLKNLPVKKVPQMIYHLKALTQRFQNL